MKWHFTLFASTFLAVAATTGCKDSAGPTTGAVRVTVTTTGIDLDADGYVVTVDGEASRAVAPVDAITLRELPTGAHTVALGGLSPNCVVGGDNPRTVSVAGGATAEMAFAIACVPDVGSLQVTTATAGLDLDSDGYTVNVDGGTGQVVGVNGALTISDLRSGERLVRLDGLAANCTVSEPNPRPVGVSFGATAEVAFAVACAADVGNLQVTTATSGADLDSDGYTVSVDGAPGEGVGVNGALTISDVRSGEHLVQLDGVAANCTLSEPNPRPVAVTFGTTEEVAFGVACTALTGDLQVTVATTGEDLDPDGYAVSVDDATGRPLPPNGSVTFVGLPVGEHTIRVDGLASNCALGGENPRSVSVPNGGTGETAFAVTCAALTGSLHVSTATTGADLDPDGYTVSVHGGPGQAVPVNGAITISGLPAGDHVVALDGVAMNCVVEGANPRTVSVPGGAGAEVAFALTCVANAGSLRVTAVTTGADLDPNGYSLDLRGKAQVVPVNGAITYAGVPAGEYPIELTDVASNCVVSGANPSSVTITFGATTEVTFAVACTAVTGSIRVTAATTGADLDTDGYTVTVDGGGPPLAEEASGTVTISGSGSSPIGVNDTVLFSGLGSGDHSVALTGVAANCTVDGPNPRSVSVASGDTAAVGFAVTCVATGSLQVTTATTGADLDPDGYTVSVDGGPGHVVAANGAVTISGLLPGDHMVALDGVAANCVADGANLRTVSVPSGGVAEVAFAVTCAATGSVRVRTTTTGTELDADGYTTSVDAGGPPLAEDASASGAATISGSRSSPIGLNDTVLFSGLGLGDHSVALAGIAANCTVDGPNPRVVSVAGGDTTAVDFAVTCTATGALQVTTATTGADLDPDGYLVSVDGGPGQAVPVNGAITVPGLPTGDHTVTLADVAANCAVDGANPRPASVAAGATAEVTFAVACLADVGSLRVTTATTGADLDADGYLVSVDGGPSQAVGANSALTLPDLRSVEHLVRLDGLAANCTVSEPNPRSVTVSFGATAEVAFTVSCTAVTTPGAVRVTVATTGADLDPDGYTVFAQGLCHLVWDGGFTGPYYECDYERTESVGVSGAVTIPDVPVGATVELQDVARNCAVAGENPRTATADVAFAVTCVATGSVRVTIATTGFDLDPDGYSVRVQDAGVDVSYGVAVNGTVTIQLLPGEHSVMLTGVWGNCTVGGQNPVTLSVVAGATLDVAFDVTCTALGSIQVTVATTGADIDQGYSVGMDGAWYGTYPAPANGAITISGLLAGEHSVALHDVAANCVVEGTNPRPVSVAAGGTTEVAFAVTCAALGSVRVTVATTGSELDPDGYRVSVDGLSRGAVPVSGAITVSGLLAGEHRVALEGVAANCVVEGTNPRPVSVAAGGTTDVTFAVTCAAPGSIQVTAATTGVDLDPNGYLVQLPGSWQSLPANGAFTLTGVPPGEYSIGLSDIASNCAVSGVNPHTVTVTSGATSEVAFAVICTAATGVVEVAVATTGAEPQSNDYLVRIDLVCDYDEYGGEYCYHLWEGVVTANGTVRFSGVPVGDHTVWLDVARNCAVVGENPRTASVPPGDTGRVAFAVICEPLGSVRVTVATSGFDLDPDGYSARVQGAGDDVSQGVAVSGIVTISQLLPGEHTVTLGGVAANCTVGGQNPVTLTVVGGATVDVAFTLTCAALGSVQVTAVTNGTTGGNWGFWASVDGRSGYSLGLNGTVTIPGIVAGPHAVTLGGSKVTVGQCQVSGENPRGVLVTAGETVAVTFQVTCTSGGVEVPGGAEAGTRTAWR